MRFFGYKIFKEKALDSCFFNRDKLFELLLKDIKQPVIFDVGANIGQSIELFKKGAKEAIIHSFEPNIECEAQLRKIAAKYSDVYINMCGIGAGGGRILLHRYSEHSINSFIEISQDSYALNAKSHHKINDTLMQVQPKAIECEVTSVDEYCQKTQINHINVLKIDVQGFENEVFCGAKSMLKAQKIDTIVVEIEFDDIYGRGNSFYELESYLVPYGYKLYDISHIYKDLNLGRTCWVDAIYVHENYLKNILKDIKKGSNAKA